MNKKQKEYNPSQIATIIGKEQILLIKFILKIIQLIFCFIFCLTRLYFCTFLILNYLHLILYSKIFAQSICSLDLFLENKIYCSILSNWKTLSWKLVLLTFHGKPFFSHNLQCNVNLFSFYFHSTKKRDCSKVSKTLILKVENVIVIPMPGSSNGAERAEELLE